MTASAGGERYGGIDAVKLAAAFLVVAIHTGPLLTYGEYPDFLLTGIFSRLAVPLFFMASGYLFFRKLTGQPRKDGRALRKYGGKVAALYGIAMVIYLPLNVYKGDFREGFTAGSLLRDVLVDGTFYHLWYLPALWLGIHLVYFLHKKLSVGGVLALALALYAVGLLGDSYYGLAIQSPVLEGVYDWMFLWFDYTRNGLFFAPVFLALGLWAAQRSGVSGEGRGVHSHRAAIAQEQEHAAHRGRTAIVKEHGVHRHDLAARDRRSSFAAGQRPVATRHTLGLTALFLLSLAGLFAEGTALRAAEWPRHDSMYVMLLPAVGTLFLLALRASVRVGPLAGSVSQWLYLLHPAAIVAVRGIAGAAGLDRLLVGHSLLHYVAVCTVSLAASLAVSLLADRHKSKRARAFRDPSTPSNMA